MSNLSISKAWDDARPIIARDGRLMFIVALVTVVLPGTLMMLVAPEQAQMGEMAVDAESATGGLFLLSMVVALLGIVGSVAISYLALFRGASVGDSLRRGLKRLLTVIGMALIFLIPAFILAVILVAVFVGVDRAASLEDPETLRALGPAAVLAFLILLIAMIYVSVRLILTTPVVAAEDIGPWGTIKRSWALTRGQFWRLLGFFLLFVISVLVVMMVAGIIIGLIVSLLFGDPEPLSVSALVTGLMSSLVQAGITIVYSTIIARIYHQLAGNIADPTVPHVEAD